MKRVLLAALLVAATTAPAAAIELEKFDVAIHGDFKNRLMYTNQQDVAASYVSEPGVINVNVPDADILNAVDTKKNANDSDFFAEAKYRLWLEGKTKDDAARGVIAFEFGASQYGSDNMDFGGDSRDYLEVRWLYTDFLVPFDPASRLSLGLQPVGYNAYFWNDNAAGIKWSSKRERLSYSLGWWRNSTDPETGSAANRDGSENVYVIDLGFAPNDVSAVGAFAAYSNSKDTATTQPSTFLNQATNVSDRIVWLGLAGSTQVNNLFFGGTAIYQTGEIRSPDFIGTGGTSLDRNAFLLNAEAAIALGKFNAKGGWLFASGDDNPNDGDVNNYHSLQAYLENINSMVLSSYWADDNYMIGANYFVDRGFNVPYINLGYALSEKCSLGVNWFWWTTAEEVAGEDVLGQELNVILSHDFGNGLSAGINAGYLVAGDLWDRMSSTGKGDDIFRSEASLRFQF
jgi:hypothetical protein